ncbi:AraC family transcriptional regulator [Peribacillus simplex]|uniref:helix-turn-helix transcriptional regulator n=1 Tax=Peribacillus simplex TaxID=1478 RepID=UPI003D2D7AB3
MKMNRMVNRKDIPYICNLMFKTFDLPVFYLNENKKVTIKLPETFKANPLFEGIEELLGEITHFYQGTLLPAIHMTNFLEHFLILRLPGHPSLGTIVIGPSFYKGLTEESKKILIIDNKAPGNHHDQWFQYYENIPVINQKRLAYIGTLLYYLVCGKTLKVNEVLEQSYIYSPKVTPTDHLDVIVSNQRENKFFHMDPSFEKNLYHLIKVGKKDEALKAYLSFPKEAIGTLSKQSYLRSRKNFAITAVTLWTRAAINGGLDWETAYTMSDMHIQHIEELEAIYKVENAIIDVLLEFVDVERRNKGQIVSKPVLSCQNYIFKHLYRKITLENLGEHTGLNPSYLSQLFIKETGIPVSEYIQRQRIEEAKRLLILTDYTVSEISFILNFNDQSYFTKVFKKHTDVTPRQFRNSHEFEI